MFSLRLKKVQALFTAFVIIVTMLGISLCLDNVLLKESGVDLSPTDEDTSAILKKLYEFGEISKSDLYISQPFTIYDYDSASSINAFLYLVYDDEGQLYMDISVTADSLVRYQKDKNDLNFSWVQRSSDNSGSNSTMALFHRLLIEKAPISLIYYGDDYAVIYQSGGTVLSWIPEEKAGKEVQNNYSEQQIEELASFDAQQIVLQPITNFVNF